MPYIIGVLDWPSRFDPLPGIVRLYPHQNFMIGPSELHGRLPNVSLLQADLTKLFQDVHPGPGHDGNHDREKEEDAITAWTSARVDAVAARMRQYMHQLLHRCQKQPPLRHKQPPPPPQYRPHPPPHSYPPPPHHVHPNTVTATAAVMDHTTTTHTNKTDEKDVLLDENRRVARWDRSCTQHVDRHDTKQEPECHDENSDNDDDDDNDHTNAEEDASSLFIAAVEATQMYQSFLDQHPYLKPFLPMPSISCAGATATLSTLTQTSKMIRSPCLNVDTAYPILSSATTIHSIQDDPVDAVGDPPVQPCTAAVEPDRGDNNDDNNDRHNRDMLDHNSLQKCIHHLFDLAIVGNIRRPSSASTIDDHHDNDDDVEEEEDVRLGAATASSRAVIISLASSSSSVSLSSAMGGSGGRRCALVTLQQLVHHDSTRAHNPNETSLMMNASTDNSVKCNDMDCRRRDRRRQCRRSPCRDFYHQQQQHPRHQDHYPLHPHPHVTHPEQEEEHEKKKKQQQFHHGVEKAHRPCHDTAHANHPHPHHPRRGQNDQRSSRDKHRRGSLCLTPHVTVAMKERKTRDQHLKYRQSMERLPQDDVYDTRRGQVETIKDVHHDDDDDVNRFSKAVDDVIMASTSHNDMGKHHSRHLDKVSSTQMSRHKQFMDTPTTPRSMKMISTTVSPSSSSSSSVSSSSSLSSLSLSSLSFSTPNNNNNDNKKKEKKKMVMMMTKKNDNHALDIEKRKPEDDEGDDHKDKMQRRPHHTIHLRQSSTVTHRAAPEFIARTHDNDKAVCHIQRWWRKQKMHYRANHHHYHDNDGDYDDRQLRRRESLTSASTSSSSRYVHPIHFSHDPSHAHQLSWSLHPEGVTADDDDEIEARHRTIEMLIEGVPVVTVRRYLDAYI